MCLPFCVANFIRWYYQLKLDVTGLAKNPRKLSQGRTRRTQYMYWHIYKYGLIMQSIMLKICKEVNSFVLVHEGLYKSNYSIHMFTEWQLKFLKGTKMSSLN